MATIKNGSRFGVYNGDAKGTVVSATSLNVSYFYDHDREKVWDRDRRDFEKNTYSIEDDLERDQRIDRELMEAEKRAA